MAYDALEIDPARYTSPDVLQENAGLAAKGFGHAAVNLNFADPKLNQVFNAANPSVAPKPEVKVQDPKAEVKAEVKAEATPAQPEPTGQKMTIETGRPPMGQYKVEGAGEDVRHTGQTGMGVKSSILGDCLDVGCKMLTKESQPLAQDIKLHQEKLEAAKLMKAPEPEPEIQTTYTPDLTMKSPGMMA